MSSSHNFFDHADPDDNLPPLQPFATGTVDGFRNSPSPPPLPLIHEANLNDVFLPWYNQYNPLPQSPNHDLPGSSFFDHILNPAGLDHGRYSPFAYPPLPSPYTTSDTAAMPPSTRTNPEGSQRPARLPNGYVDLTATPDSPPRCRKRASSSPGPSNKRRKQEDGTAATQDGAEPPKVEEVDLTDDAEPIQEILQKQRADAVKAQEKPEETRTTFNTFTCVICMDTPTDLTATACGHLFCHTCLMEALIAGENRTGPGETKRSQCPVCRKVINRTKASDIIPLLLKKGLSTQPRKKVAVSPTVAAAKV